MEILHLNARMTRENRSIYIFLPLLLLFFLIRPADAAIPVSERQALLGIYSSTGGPAWTISSGWGDPDGTECTWYGVYCAGDQVRQVNLSGNNLVGILPSITALTALQYFYVDSNHLTGDIPSLTGLAGLLGFHVENNQLTGPIPSLAGLNNLQYFYAYNNRLSGAVPSLAGLTGLTDFRVYNNRLTGSLPPLTELTGLQIIDVSSNWLSGEPPAMPNSSILLAGFSRLCPNYLNNTANGAWDTATGITPWYADCTQHVTLFDGNGSSGGFLPVDNNVYTIGQIVTVPGNIGALYKDFYNFNGWNTSPDGTGTAYLGGETFTIGSSGVTLYAQWVPATGQPVRIAETLAPYADIPSAYAAALNGQTIQAQSGLGGQDLLLDNPNNYDPFSIIIRGGYDTGFSADTGASLIINSIIFSNKGSVEVDRLIVQ